MIYLKSSPSLFLQQIIFKIQICYKKKGLSLDLWPFYKYEPFEALIIFSELVVW